MKKTFPFTQIFKIVFLFVVVTPAFFSCETHNFESDKRQIMAKDKIRNELHNTHEFDITSFKEDTIEGVDNPYLKKEIRYQMDFEYIDSNNVLQKKIGDVFFASDGGTIINSKITDR
jgi:hypothetical protein